MRIDLNADIGEGFEEVERDLLPLVSSVNVACGAHAGDPPTMRRSMGRALELGLSVGAHPGYPDRGGFGRTAMTMPAADVEAWIVAQLGAAGAVARSLGLDLRHVKPHGALYTGAAVDRALARAVAGAVRSYSAEVALVGPPGSALLEAGLDAGLRVLAEGFADRAYQADGSLRPRSNDGAVLSDPETVAAQAVAIARQGRAPLQGGGWVPVPARTICLHGDSPRAVEFARAVRAALEAAGVGVAAADLAGDAGWPGRAAERWGDAERRGNAQVPGTAGWPGEVERPGHPGRPTSGPAVPSSEA